MIISCLSLFTCSQSSGKLGPGQTITGQVYPWGLCHLRLRKEIVWNCIHVCFVCIQRWTTTRQTQRLFEVVFCICCLLAASVSRQCDSVGFIIFPKSAEAHQVNLWPVQTMTNRHRNITNVATQVTCRVTRTACTTACIPHLQNCPFFLGFTRFSPIAVATRAVAPFSWRWSPHLVGRCARQAESRRLQSVRIVVFTMWTCCEHMVHHSATEWTMELSIFTCIILHHIACPYIRYIQAKDACQICNGIPCQAFKTGPDDARSE